MARGGNALEKRGIDSELDQDYPEDVRPRPFVKWVGGKRQLLAQLISRMPEKYGKYYEPFLGGGALFFAVQPEKAVLSDCNQDLINAYEVIQSNPQALIKSLTGHTAKHCEEYYYEQRALDREANYAKKSAVERASRLIYLNKTCFNGLYRVNSKGYFNVPFGAYKNPKICDAENLLACGNLLKSAKLHARSYKELLKTVKAGDFVYLDPPYAPLSATSNFTNYAADGFGAQDQVDLRDFCRKLDEKGAHWMLSNSAAELIYDLYKDFHIEEVQASRNINSQAEGRGKITELIIRNYGA
jgi:DNA adenine methylase